jgi:hypothetical protein
MSIPFKVAVILAVAAVLSAATLIIVPRMRAGRDDADLKTATEEFEPEDDAESVFSGTEDDPLAGESSHVAQTARNGSSDSLDDREKAKFDVAEMRNEIEDMLRKFRGTPEERQEVIDECEQGKELFQLIAELSESSIEEMSPEELEKERESFEKQYRAQLDYLQTGRAQRMLKTPEEQEVIGGAIEAAQDFLERIDAALQSVGY